MSFKMMAADAAPELVRLSAPKNLGQLLQVDARTFVAVAAGDRLEWREKTYRCLVDDRGQPVKPVDEAVPGIVERYRSAAVHALALRRSRMALTREQIMQLNLRPVKVQKLLVPDFGEIYLRMLSGADRDSYESDRYSLDQKTGSVRYTIKNARAQFFVRCVCDEHGKRLFSDSEAEFVGGIPNSGVLLDKVYEVGRKFNKMTRESEEELEKNSESPATNAGPGSDSAAATASPSTSV